VNEVGLESEMVWAAEPTVVGTSQTTSTTVDPGAKVQVPTAITGYTPPQPGDAAGSNALANATVEVITLDDFVNGTNITYREVRRAT
jgi:hypothetical protein